MIRIQGLHKFFNKGRSNEIHVINDISLDLPEKGMVAIFGKSGCGKTTLLNVIGGLDKYAEGTLTIENQSIRENTDVIRNQYIGYIFQNYNLNKAESCFDNVADALRLCGMTDKDEIEARVTAALTNAGMEKYAKRTPDTLSGGQQQRIAIARAIVKNPRIILADEPTGNLDEANTVMIMDLLKAIARDHLVLLVTHEANLVDYYCDTVIELQDGKVVETKQNTSATGFAARDKNDIFLGELSRREISDDSAEIEYYGELPEKPIKLKIVNHSGKLYVEIGTEKVQILDHFSEVKLREGVYEEKANANAVSEGIDMTKLPPVNGTRFGHLFSLKSSVKSGYASNFKHRKKGKRVLRGCMALFAAVIVFMSTIFGSAFGDIIEAKNAYNHNVFYLYTPNGTVSAKLNEAVGKAETGIDYIR
ncbi:MAG: ABC transporter ATP-binding protein, partial [Clostridia bacterium]|nr:ABC transporter ATP-binding protein [Clostridia bacterium]